MEDILSIGKKLGIDPDFIESYGRYMAKVSLKALGSGKSNGKLILVTAMTPTKYGEGKTTTAIGLSQAFKKLGKKASISIREPSMGPCFGVKGGATGGGKSKVEPSDRINLMFTGDFPAISAAHNLLSSMIQNHIYHGNKLQINPEQIVFPRTIDMNDRSLREIILNAGDKKNGPLTRDSFVIAPASEIMAIMGFATGYDDLLKRLSRIFIGYNYDGQPVYSGDLKAAGAMAAILSDALKPNLVQTTEGVPAFIHTGPFGNIAHGTSSILAAKLALNFSDYVITEAGFGSDLGAEKFINMVSRLGKLEISAVVIVSTIRAMKLLGGSEDKEGISKGFMNLVKHYENIRNFNLEPVIAINRFPSDTDEELEFLGGLLGRNNMPFQISEVFTRGGDGAISLAEALLVKCEQKHRDINYTYSFGDEIEKKIEKIGKNIYGVKEVDFSKKALSDIRKIAKNGYGNLPVCMAKSQYSLSGNSSGVDDNILKVTSISVSSGAGFIVVYSGDIMTMPGLPKEPAAENIYIDGEGNIYNLE
ncbi:MAG: formate--tetrahydrofolate ligase [Candidatus Thermoplasmatota archaeon]|nr:formate--tetrahydrofolate ligase [Candidatus Thermoplasmatota archaeon]